MVRYFASFPFFSWNFFLIHHSTPQKNSIPWENRKRSKTFHQTTYLLFQLLIKISGVLKFSNFFSQMHPKVKVKLIYTMEGYYRCIFMFGKLCRFSNDMHLEIRNNSKEFNSLSPRISVISFTQREAFIFSNFRRFEKLVNFSINLHLVKSNDPKDITSSCPRISFSLPIQ